MKTIGFAGTDGRTLLSALTVSTARSNNEQNEYQGVVVRGNPAMRKMSALHQWPIDFVDTIDNQPTSYAAAIIEAFEKNELDYALVMPESLMFGGVVDAVIAAGFGDRIAGLTQAASFIEADKIACKYFCQEENLPVADAWIEVDAKEYTTVLATCLEYIHQFGGVVLKYPYGAAGKGARIILNTWEIKEVYDTLLKDYQAVYVQMFGKKNKWPLLIESRMSGVEISFTILVDENGHFQILPTSMDYPERFSGPASKENPITGGMGSISPHPMETSALLELAKETIAKPLIQAMQKRVVLRPCILYPGCFVSFDERMQPTNIRVCEINIRPGEPEFQPVMRRLRNPGQLIEAMFAGTLDTAIPEVREDQIAMSIALVTGPGGPQGQKGYPWSCTKAERTKMDFGYLKKKGITLIPSAMDWDDHSGCFKSDGTRVAYLIGNGSTKPGQSKADAAEILRTKLYSAIENQKVRVIPRENENGNRLDCRKDIGSQYVVAAQMFTK